MEMKIWKFKSRELAISFADRGHALAVILGDDDRFWVVTMAVAAKLERGGYQFAK